MKEFSLPILIKLYFAWLIFIFFATETLSYLHLISRQSVIFGDLIFFISFFYFQRKELVHLFRKNFKIDKFILSEAKKNLFIFSLRNAVSFLLRNQFNLIISLLAILIFIQGTLSAPSTTDAITYQILRTMYWIQEGTVYQDFIRNSHDFMPPFASYILMHLYLIFGGDRFLFLSQWLAYVGSIFLSQTIARQFGANQKLSQVTSLLVAVIPIAVLQASSTQADMVSAFITLLIFHLVLIFLKEPTYKNTLLMGLALGLGMLVKAPFYIFVIIPLSLFFLLLGKNPKKAIVTGAIVLALALAMNLRYYSQNTKLYGNPSGQKFRGVGNTYVNERFDPPAIVSNLIKNTMNNIPVPLFTNQVQSTLVALHNTMGIDIADPKTTYIGLDFKVAPVIYPQEDLAASPFHILLIMLAGFFVFRKSFKHKYKTELKILYLFLVAAYIIFATILKYESVHNRLLVPFLIVGTIIVSLVLSNSKFGQWMLRLFLFLSVPLAFILVLLNVQHPYLSYNSFYDRVKGFTGSYQILPEAFYIKPRIQQYFNSRPYWYEPYDEVADLIVADGKNQIITMELIDDEFEYPLWAILKQKGVNFYVYQNKFLKNEPRPDSLLLTTSEKPYAKTGWQTQCFKTQTDYGYACLSKIWAF